MIFLSRRSAAVALAVALLLAAAAPDSAADPRGDPPRRDEFGLVPEEPRDRDLALPDPVLDRTWPGPKPGAAGPAVEPDEPEGDERRPSMDGDAAPLLPKRPGDAPAAAKPAPRPAAPRVGPDGRRDPGSPAPELDPALPDVLERDAPDLSDLEKDEARPSPLDRGGDPYADDAGDPGAEGE